MLDSVSLRERMPMHKSSELGLWSGWKHLRKFMLCSMCRNRSGVHRHVPLCVGPDLLTQMPTAVVVGNCTANIARCTNPCRRALCPAYPEAQCYTSRCGQCEAFFMWNGTLVDCDESSGDFSLFSDANRSAESSAPSPMESNFDCRHEV